MCDAEVTPFTADRGCSAPFPGCAAPSDVSSAGDVAQTLVTQLLNASGVRTVWASMGTGSALHQARAAHEFFYISSLSRSSPPVERGLLRARACACMRARRPAFTGTARRCGTSCSKGQRTCLCPMLRVGLLPALHSMLCSCAAPRWSHAPRWLAVPKIQTNLQTLRAGWQALHYAACFGRLDCIALLVGAPSV